MKFKFLTKNILLLSFVSFFTDIASEIIYPILPLYFTSIGLSYVIVGAIEGVTQLIAGLSKVFFGLYSDKLGKRVIFLNLGYGISAFAKPLIGLSSSIYIILFARVTDRFSKGIRTSPRDAILIEESKEEHRAKVFSFHRSLDTLGAALGPIVAILILVSTNNNYALLFQLTIIPGIIALLLTFVIKVKKDTKVVLKKPNISFANFLKKSNKEYKKLVIGLVFLAFLNVTDFFILLRIKELLIINNSFNITIPIDYLVIMFYVAYNLIFVLLANPIGMLSDKFGHKYSMLTGILLFGLMYALLGFKIDFIVLMFVIVSWAAFANINDSIGKAWLSIYINKDYKATGIGLLTTLVAIAAFLGNISVGFAIDKFGTPVAFSIIAILSLPLFLYFYFTKIEVKKG